MGLFKSKDLDEIDNINLYKASYPIDKSFDSFEREELIKFIDDNYLNNDKPDKDKLYKDLIALKTYRDKVENKIKYRRNYMRLFETLIMMSNVGLSVITIAVSFVSGLYFSKASKFFENPEANVELGKELKNNLKDLNSIFKYMICIAFAIVLLYAVSYFYYMHDRKIRKTNIKKLIVVNNSIYKLETLKEELESKDNK